MIDLKATLKNQGMSQAEFARLINRPRQQVNKWYSGVFNPSSLMEKMILEVCKKHSIKIIKK